MKYDFKNMLTNGRMAKKLGVDPKTLRHWAIDGVIPSYVNPANGYRYYSEEYVIRALRLQKINFGVAIDENRD